MTQHRKMWLKFQSGIYRCLNNHGRLVVTAEKLLDKLVQNMSPGSCPLLRPGQGQELESTYVSLTSSFFKAQQIIG